jgi:hypothetical protein
MTARLALVAAALIQLAACGKDSPPTEPQPPAEPQEVADAAAPIEAAAEDDAASADDASGGTDARDCMPKEHPGTVTVVNGDTGEVRIQVVDEYNEAAFWVTTPEGRVPVVKLVIRSLRGLANEIKSYGPCDQLLEVTVGH